MGGNGEIIDICVLYVDGNMACGLHGVSMEQNAAGSAYFTYICDRLDRSDLVVCPHDSDKACVFPDRRSYLVFSDETGRMYVEKGDLESFPAQTLERMKDGVVFESCRNNVFFTLFGAGMSR